MKNKHLKEPQISHYQHFQAPFLKFIQIHHFWEISHNDFYKSMNKNKI